MTKTKTVTFSLCASTVTKTTTTTAIVTTTPTPTCSETLTGGAMYLCNDLSTSKCLRGIAFQSTYSNFNQFEMKSGKMELYGYGGDFYVPDALLGGYANFTSSPSAGDYLLNCCLPSVNSPVTCYNHQDNPLTAYESTEGNVGFFLANPNDGSTALPNFGLYYYH